jgi:hypothetical protein
MSPNRAKRREQFRKLGQAISRFVSDPQAGLCRPHPWKVKNSGGFQVANQSIDNDGNRDGFPDSNDQSAPSSLIHLPR